jgi:hypothetical protein
MKRTRFIVPTPFTLGSSALQKVRNRRPPSHGGSSLFRPSKPSTGSGLPRVAESSGWRSRHWAQRFRRCAHTLLHLKYPIVLCHHFGAARALRASLLDGCDYVNPTSPRGWAQSEDAPSIARLRRWI